MSEMMKLADFMEGSYFRDLMRKAEDDLVQFVDELLEEAAGANPNAEVFRVRLEYPRHESDASSAQYAISVYVSTFDEMPMVQDRGPDIYWLRRRVER